MTKTEVDEHRSATSGTTATSLQQHAGSQFDVAQDVIFETVQSDSYTLSYTCLLIPRFPGHQLKGDLADMLPDWLRTICVSFGWKMEFVTVEHDYLQWGMFVNASTSPALFMRVIRQELSREIMSNFGRISRENLSGDFWADGHLVVLGIRPHPQQMIHQYIRMIRKQQGFDSL